MSLDFPLRSSGAIGERSLCSEAFARARVEQKRSANVGMSNFNSDEKSGHRKSKVSWAMMISSGLVGPKANPEFTSGVADGQLVNIPAPLIILDGATKSGSFCALWLCAFKVCRNCFCGKSIKTPCNFCREF